MNLAYSTKGGDWDLRWDSLKEDGIAETNTNPLKGVSSKGYGIKRENIGWASSALLSNKSHLFIYFIDF